MEPSSSSSSSPVSQRAEALFVSFLQEREQDSGVDFESFRAQHPDLAGELGWLQERHGCADEMLRRMRGATAEDEVEVQSPDGRYEVLGEIARGGMGRVLEVHDSELDRVLAMKVLRKRGHLTDADHRRQRRRLVNEAHVLGKLEHPSIVPVHEVGSDARGDPYFTMLRVRGKALSEIFEDVAAGRDGWTTMRATDVLLRVCEAMAHAHSKGIVHRDLKPANVMVGPFGEVFVMDWGLAKVRGEATVADIRLRSTSLEPGAEDVGTDEASASLLTMDGDVLGTPSYMPPEQAQGSVDDVDERSDVYSLGAMLYHLLAGRAPYLAPGTSSTPREILQAVLRGDPDPLERVAPEATRELASVCAKAMARVPARRYAGMRELADDLRAFLENRVVRAHATGALVELVKWVQRHRMVVAVLGVLLAVLVGSTIGLALLYREAQGQRDLAEERYAFLEQNPSGHRMDFSAIPTLSSFLEEFDTELAPPLRISYHPRNIEQGNGRIVFHRRGPSESMVGLELNDSQAMIRGDFELSVSFESAGFSLPELGARDFGLAVRQAKDGRLVGSVSRAAERPTAGRPFEGIFAIAGTGASEHVRVPCGESRGALRIVRAGTHLSLHATCNGWQEVLSAEVTDGPLMFSLWANARAGDDGEFDVAFDDLELLNTPGSKGELIGPIEENFERDMGLYLVPDGDAGVAAVVNGRLRIENFPDAAGYSSVALDSRRFVLRSDFEISLQGGLTWNSGGQGFVEFMLTLEPNCAKLGWDSDNPEVVRAWRFTDGDWEGADSARGSDKVRIRRVAGRVTMDYWDAGWKELLSTESHEDLDLWMKLTNHGDPVGAVADIEELRMEGVSVRR